MSFTDEQIKALSGPLDRNAVKERKQAGRNLSYIEAWWAIAEANRIFGFDAWDRETVTLTETNRDLIEVPDRDGVMRQQWRVGYLAKVKIRVAAGRAEDPSLTPCVTREGTGFGSGMAKPEALGDAIESAIKEAESDAMKRALMTFGNPFGLALYDKTQANVADPNARKSAAQCKRDGDNETIKAELAAITDQEGLGIWWATRMPYWMGIVPASWEDPIRDQYLTRKDEITDEQAKGQL